MYQDPIDYDDPRAILEAEEMRADMSPCDVDTIAMGAALGRVLAWLLEAPSLNKVGFRAYVIAHKLRPELIGGMSFADMANKLGQGRSSAHKLSKEFASIFGIRGLNDKSDDARRKYRQAWRRSNITPCTPNQSSPPSRLNAPAR